MQMHGQSSSGFAYGTQIPQRPTRDCSRRCPKRPGLALSAGRRHQQADIQVSLPSEQMPSVVKPVSRQGKEYVVDHFSLDGEHKTMMIWVHDKRAVNGAAFVYHGMLDPLRAGRPGCAAGQERAHARRGDDEADGPCPVEVNYRAHGGDGTWITRNSADRWLHTGECHP